MKVGAAVPPLLNQLKTRVAFFAVAIAVMPGMMNARSAYAQNVSQATIPFAFSANHQAFPAGLYRVVRESDSTIRVMSMETGIETAFLVHTSRSFEASPKNSFVFLHDDRGFRLLKLRFGQGGVQSDVSLHAQPEREIAKAATTEIGMN